MNKREIIEKHIRNGVVFLNTESLEIDENTVLENGVEIGYSVKLENSIVGENTKIGNNCYILSSKIGQNNEIIQSQIENSKIENDNKIGPFSHLRPGSHIKNNCRIGNFVEIKNSLVGDKTKIAHLSYVGDATIGENVNIGCGVIFANYDGKKKHHTEVGDNVFIGSNSNLIAPIKVGSNVLIGAGTTVTKNIPANKLCIGRAREEVKDFKENKSSKKLFGTDGIRGEFGKEITPELAFKCGNALASIKKGAKILIARDTRDSGSILLKNFCEGAKVGGSLIYDIGIMPTPSVAYLTREEKFDYGVVISASHNPENYNGIKIISHDGRKCTEDEEMQIEVNMQTLFKFDGGKVQKTKITQKYIDFLINSAKNKINKTILLDCANGATEKTAKQAFKKLGVKFRIIKNKTTKINDDCGSTHIENLLNNFNKEDIGFSFDGDGDRIMCAFSNGEILDGDKILLLLSLYYQRKGILKNNTVVGTINTNKAIEDELGRRGIKLIRAKIGDKFVVEEMFKSGAKIGSEQSGHITLKDYLPSGDGVLTAIKISEIYSVFPDLVEEVIKTKLYPQENINFKINDREKVLKDKKLVSLIENTEKEFGEDGRVLVRPSGTEPKIRVMIEHKNEEICKKKTTEFVMLFKNLAD